MGKVLTFFGFLAGLWLGISSFLLAEDYSLNIFIISVMALTCLTISPIFIISVMALNCLTTLPKPGEPGGKGAALVSLMNFWRAHCQEQSSSLQPERSEILQTSSTSTLLRYLKLQRLYVEILWSKMWVTRSTTWLDVYHVIGLTTCVWLTPPFSLLYNESIFYTSLFVCKWNCLYINF